MRTARSRRGSLHLRHPAQYVLVTFAGASVAGTALLMLPIASEEPGGASLITALFTATSAVCVTGLFVVDTAGFWSGFGEGVILFLIQIGGFGIMTLSSLIALFLARRLGLRHRIVAASAVGSLDLGDVRRIIIGVAKFSLAVEAVVAGSLGLWFWSAEHEAFGRAFYLGLFHAVSAFNNAGFALFDDNLVGFADVPFVVLLIAATIVVGGLGFPVWLEIMRRPRRPREWNLHTKLTLLTTVVLVLVGWALLAWFEWTNAATFGQLSAGDSAANALFHSITPRTAGFNTIDIAAMREPSRLLTEVLMFVGGGSASTAGGIKVTTFALLGWVMWAEVRGDPDVVVFGRRVPGPAQRQALTIALIAIGAIVASSMVLMSVSDLGRSDVFFEAVSAIGTVGLSAGATPLLPTSGHLLIAGMMLLGRVGPVTLFAALVLRERPRLYRHPEERPIIG